MKLLPRYAPWLLPLGCVAAYVVASRPKGHHVSAVSVRCNCPTCAPPENRARDFGPPPETEQERRARDAAVLRALSMLLEEEAACAGRPLARLWLWLSDWMP